MEKKMDIEYTDKCRFEIKNQKSSGMVFRHLSAQLEHW
jgi:hypothetical protein